MHQPSQNELSAAIVAAAARNRAGLMAMLKRLGVSRASDLPTARWAALITELDALPVDPDEAERKAAEAQRQIEADAKEDQDHYEKFGPPKSYRSKTFANYETKTPEQKTAVEAALDWCCGYKEWRNLLLVGPVGTGKTHLGCAVLHEEFFLSGTSNFEFISATDLACDFREKKQKESEFFKWYGEDCELLVIDDLGAIAGATPGELFGVLLDKRMNNDLRTVFTTNATAADLKKVLTDRGFSRMNDKCMTVCIDGDDYRLKS